MMTEAELKKKEKELRVSKRAQKLERMDKWLRLNINDEEEYYRWLNLVPDEATMEDFQDIAEDSGDYFLCCELFALIVMADTP